MAPSLLCARTATLREHPLRDASAGDRAQRATLGADHAHALTTTPPCANGHPSLSKRPLCSSCIPAASVTAMPISAAATALPPARLDLPRARDLRRAGRPAPCPPVEATVPVLPKAPKAIEVLAPLTRTRSVRASQGQARAGTAVRSTRVQDGVGGARVPAAPRRHPGDSPICESVGGTFSETRRFRLLKLDEGLRLARSSKRLLERPRPQIRPPSFDQQFAELLTAQLRGRRSGGPFTSLERSPFSDFADRTSSARGARSSPLSGDQSPVRTRDPLGSGPIRPGACRRSSVMTTRAARPVSLTRAVCCGRPLV